jgi:hypothetical protein
MLGAAGTMLRSFLMHVPYIDHMRANIQLSIVATPVAGSYYPSLDGNGLG